MRAHIWHLSFSLCLIHFSVAVCRFPNTGDDWYVLVGVARDMILNPRSVGGGFIYTYRLISGGEKLEFVHKVGLTLHWIQLKLCLYCYRKANSFFCLGYLFIHAKQFKELDCNSQSHPFTYSRQQKGKTATFIYCRWHRCCPVFACRWWHQNVYAVCRSRLRPLSFLANRWCMLYLSNRPRTCRSAAGWFWLSLVSKLKWQFCD